MNETWAWCKLPIKLEEIFSSKNRYCFLVGSGISLDPPSCLPTGYQLTKMLLERFIPPEEQKNILSLMDPEREGMEERGDFLRFEELVDYLHRWYYPELDFLDFFAECRRPNQNHLFLALMLQKGYEVMTTNFDNLIEHGLLEIKIPKKRIYSIINQEDWKNISHHKGFNVYKLHGSITNFRNDQNCKSSLKATIRQISQSERGMLYLESWKKEIVQKITQNNDLVILGYSGLDDFDILPTLWNISSSKRILWIDHDPSRSPSQAVIEIIKKSEVHIEKGVSKVGDIFFLGADPGFVRSMAKTLGHSPEENNTAMDRLGQNLLKFVQMENRQPNTIFRIRVDNGKLVSWLWKQFGLRELPKAKTFLVASKKLTFEDFLPPYIKLPESAKWTLTAQIFEDRQFPTQSFEAFQKGLEKARLENDKVHQARCLERVGRHLMNNSAYKKADIAFKEALDLYEQLGNLKGQAFVKYLLSQNYNHQNNIRLSEKYAKEGLDISIKLGDKLAKAYNLGAMADVFVSKNQLSEALRTQKEILTLQTEIGNTRGQITSLLNIGVAYDLCGNRNEGKKFVYKAFEEAKKLGYFSRIYNTLTVLINIALHEKDFDKAIEYRKEITRVCERLRKFDKRYNRAQYQNLRQFGTLYTHKRQMSDALDTYKGALKIAEEMEDKRLQMKSLRDCGELYKVQRKFKEALNHHKKAKIIADQLEDEIEIAQCLIFIAKLYSIMMRLEESLEMYNDALRIAKKLGNFQLIAFIQMGIREIQTLKKGK